MDALGQNLKFAVRQLWRNPGFTVTVILTLALSIGANTAIFSIVNALMLKSLPYSHPERMGTIYTRVTGTRASDERHHVNGEQWELLRDNVPSLMSAVSSGRNFRRQSSGGISCAVSSGGTHLGALSRCAGDPSCCRAQLLGDRGSCSWAEDRHPELRLVAK